MRYASSTVILALLLIPALAGAQQLSPDVTNSCVRAAVKIIALGPNDQGSTGSGSMIDARGYVLTNFHVVGHTGHETGMPGALINPDNTVFLATVDSPRQTARPRWVGMVVRANIQLDLALVRIVADMDGNGPIEANFPTVEMAPTTNLLPGTQLWAFGYPLGVRTINVTGGHVTGFQMNTRDEVSWIRSDAEFNPGNSGGMLVDNQGRLIAVPTAVFHGQSTLEPIEMARPVERIPTEWLESLRQGHIDDVRIEGPVPLNANQIINDASVGDGGTFGTPEIHYYTLPPERPGAVTLSHPLPVMLGVPLGVLVRESIGGLAVEAADPVEALLGVVLPTQLDETYNFAITYELTPPEPPVVADAEPPVADVEPPVIDAEPPAADAEPPLADAEPPPADTEPPGPKDLTTQAASDTISVAGYMVDAMTGRPVDGMIVIGLPGSDLEANIEALLAGRMSDTEFDTTVIGGASTDVRGWYNLTGVPRGETYPFAGLARDYALIFFEFPVGEDAPSLYELNPLQMMR